MLKNRQAIIKTDNDLRDLLDSRLVSIDRWGVDEMKIAVQSSEVYGRALIQLMKQKISMENDAVNSCSSLAFVTTHT
jgi:hypothetical protein